MIKSKNMIKPKTLTRSKTLAKQNTITKQSSTSQQKSYQARRKFFQIDYSAAKRGDTIIEVMVAIAVFCLVAVVSISMMNAGVSTAEGTLELVVARNELNAQAEALRFVHASYYSEKTLPEYSLATADSKHQQYKELWEKITSNAIDPPDGTGSNEEILLGLDDYVHGQSSSGVSGCDRIYTSDGGQNILERNHAFVLNTRDLNSTLSTGGVVDTSKVYIPAGSTIGDTNVFRPATLNARIIFTNGTTESADEMLENSLYNYVKYAEGIWVIAVKSSRTTPVDYYDFYIESCWFGPGASSPTVLDTVIRLFNPESTS